MRNAGRRICALLCALGILLAWAPAVASAQELTEDATATFEFDPESPGRFSVACAGVPDTYDAVEARIWTRADRGDLRSYDCAPGPEGERTARGSSADFGFRAGIYMAEVVGVSADGSEETLASTSAALRYETGLLYLPEAGASPFYHFRLMGAKLPEGCPVWFKVGSQASNGKEALVYPATREENGDYAGVAAISAHGDAGFYAVGAFCGSQDDPVYLTAGSFEVPGVESASLQVTEQDGGNGTMRVRLEASGGIPVREASLAAWSSPDQSNLCWYPMEADGDGYVATVDIARHGYQFGEYVLHAYAGLANGARTLAAATSARLEARDFVSAQPWGVGMYEIQVLGPSQGQLSAAVWSEDGGQNDLIWYPVAQATSTPERARFIVEPCRHSSSGPYLAHVYAGDRLVGATRFEVSPDALRTPINDRIAQYCQNVYDTVGRDLHSVYLWTVRSIKHVVRDWPNYKFPPYLTHDQAFTLEGFEARAGDCHSFSSVFAHLARGLGYNAEYVLGYVWSVRQVWASHSFVVVHMADGDYICDPELQAVSKTGKNLYMQSPSKSKAKYKW